MIRLPNPADPEYNNRYPGTATPIDRKNKSSLANKEVQSACTVTVDAAQSLKGRNQTPGSDPCSGQTYPDFPILSYTATRKSLRCVVRMMSAGAVSAFCLAKRNPYMVWVEARVKHVPSPLLLSRPVGETREGVGISNVVCPSKTT